MTDDREQLTANRSTAHWFTAAGFWLFVSVVYAGQIWWLSRLPGEQINVRQAITWQTTYSCCGSR